MRSFLDKYYSGVMNGMSVLKKINYIFDKKQKIRLALLTIIIIVGAFVELLGISIIMPLVSIVSNTSMIHSNKYYSFFYDFFHLKSDSQFILLMIFAIIFIYIFKNIYLIIMYDLQYRFSYNNEKRLSKKMLNSYMQQSYLFHVSKNISELQRNVTTDVSMFFQTALLCMQILTEGSVCVALAFFLFFTDKSITIGVAALLIMFAFVFIKIFKKEARKLGEINRINNVQLGKWIRQSFEGIKEIKILNRESFFLEKVEYYYSSYADAQRRNMLIGVIPRPIFEAVSVTAMLLVVGVKIYRGVDLSYFIPVLSAFAIAAFRLLPSFGRLTSYIKDVNYNKSAVDSVYNDLKEVDTLMANNRERLENREPINLIDGIYVKNISFKYPSIDAYVLRNISLKIPKNKSVALVGSSGSGKTTLADIILGILTPEAGNVYADDIDIYTNPYGWHRNLGYIPQVIYLLDDSIRSNILFGVSDCEVSDEAVWTALEAAQLKEFVEGLEDGIDTVVGERGVRLSGGQRQRIGIARALYYNPEILVLDEATSALDNETEAAVMEAINGLKGKKTLLIIAHRLTTIEHCDIIYEVSHGGVIQKGAHDEKI